MKKLARVIFLAATAVAAVGIGTATARAGDVVVHSGSCANTGSTTVPAGSTISVFGGDWEVNRGVAQHWLNDQTTVISVNGGPSVDISSSYGAPSLSQPYGGAPPGTWLTSFVYPTGVTLANPGDTMSFDITVSLAHPLAEEVNGPAGFLIGFSPGTVFHSPPGSITFSCTVTAT
jgi:hypothetical protein